MSLTEAKLVEKVEHLLWTLKKVDHSNKNPLSIRMQGNHPLTGGTSVVRFKDISDIKEAKYVLQCILFGRENKDIDNFIDRCKEKVIKSYANIIEVSGFDKDGDSIEYELRFVDPMQMLLFLQTGIFSMENPDHNKYLLVDIFDR